MSESAHNPSTQHAERVDKGDFKKTLNRVEEAFWQLGAASSDAEYERVRGLAASIASNAGGRTARKAQKLLRQIESVQASPARQKYLERAELDRRTQEELVSEGANDPRQRVYKAPRSRVFKAVLRAAGELSYTITHSDHDSGVVSFNTGISFLSWGGQNVTVTVEEVDLARSRVVIGGRAAQQGNPFSGGAGQIYTFGELRSIAHKVFRAIEAVLLQEDETSESGSGRLPQDDMSDSRDAFVDQLARLSELHRQGALTDDEFAAAKAKLLN